MILLAQCFTVKYDPESGDYRPNIGIAKTKAGTGEEKFPFDCLRLGDLLNQYQILGFRPDITDGDLLDEVTIYENPKGNLALRRDVTSFESKQALVLLVCNCDLTSTEYYVQECPRHEQRGNRLEQKKGSCFQCRTAPDELGYHPASGTAMGWSAYYYPELEEKNGVQVMAQEFSVEQETLVLLNPNTKLRCIIYGLGGTKGYLLSWVVQEKENIGELIFEPCNRWQRVTDSCSPA